VQPGQQVLKYQRLADADSEYGALHAPTSGRIIAIRQQVQALPGAPLANSLILEADGRDDRTATAPGLPVTAHPARPCPATAGHGVTGNHGPCCHWNGPRNSKRYPC
jgi:electron transport complex protein RnfC